MWFVVCAAQEKACQLFWSSAVVSCFRWLIVSDSSVWLILCCSFEWQDMTSLCQWLVCCSIIISNQQSLIDWLYACNCLVALIYCLLEFSTFNFGFVHVSWEKYAILLTLYNNIFTMRFSFLLSNSWAKFAKNWLAFRPSKM